MFSLLKPKKIYIGIDISERSVEVVSIRRKGKILDIVGYGRQQIDGGVIENGKLLNEERLKKILKGVISTSVGNNENVKKVVALTVPGIEVSTETIPQSLFIEEQEVYNEIKNTVSKSLGIGRSNCLISYHILQKASLPNMKSVFVEAVEKDLLLPYLRVIKELGCEVSFVTFEGLAAVECLVPPGVEIPWILVDCGATKTRFTAFVGKTPYFSEYVSIGGDILTLELSRKLEITGDEAEKLKKEGVLKPKVKKVIQPFLTDLIKEFNSFKSTFYSHWGLTARGAVLTGGTSMMVGWKEWWNKKVDVDVMLAEPYIDFRSKIPELQLFINALGLAMKVESSDGRFGELLNDLDNEEKAALKKMELLLTVKSEDKEEKHGKTKEDKVMGKFEQFGKVVDFLLVSILVGGVGLFYLYKNGLISPLIKKERVDIGENGVSLRDEIDVAGNFTVGKDQEVKGMILAKEYSQPIVLTASGIKGIDGYAEGDVVVYNTTDKSIKIVGNSRLVTKDNILFYTQKLVSVPAHGSATVRIKCSQKGGIGDIEPQRLDFPGLADFGGAIYAENKEKLEGGYVEVRYIQESDVSEGLSSGVKLVEEKFMDLGWEFSSEDYFLVDKPLKIEEKSNSCKEKEGVEGEKSECNALYEVKALIIKKEDFEKKMSKLLEESVKKGENPREYTLKSFKIEIVSYKEEEGKVDLKAEAFFKRK